MKRFVAIMLIAVFAMALCVGAFAAGSQQTSKTGKIEYKSEAVSSDLAKQIKGGYSYTIGGQQCYSYNGVNYVVVGGDIFEVVSGASIYDADKKTGKGTSLKTGTALVAVLALTACCTGGVAVVTGKKA